MIADASKRFMAAKHRDLRYRGILFRVGKMAYDGGDFDGADKLFERSIAFGENLDAANYFRGLVALQRDDYASAQQCFRAAAAAAPFVADYPFFLAEALRRDHHPNEAKPFYTQAALVSQSDRDDAICHFKIRLARLEAGEGSKIGEEIKERQKTAPLPVEWLLTSAALAIRDGRPDDAAAPITEARAANAPDLFGICMNDFFFVNAAAKSPQLTALYGSDLTPERQLARPRRRKPIPPPQPQWP
jgi:tetratricopeptide (TPR) repeat protein